MPRKPFFLRVPSSVLILAAALWILAVPANAADRFLSTGQSVYVPVYSHIYHGNRERPFNLTATLSIRNTDLQREITIRSADYYDSSGELIRRYLDQPKPLERFSTIRYVVKADDTSGGSGAKFIVTWTSKEPVNTPIIEAIMISTQSQQGISFVSRGQAIKK